MEGAASAPYARGSCRACAQRSLPSHGQRLHLGARAAGSYHAVPCRKRRTRRCHARVSAPRQSLLGARPDLQQGSVLLYGVHVRCFPTVPRPTLAHCTAKERRENSKCSRTKEGGKKSTLAAASCASASTGSVCAANEAVGAEEAGGAVYAEASRLGILVNSI